jgi:hypothetical protein
LKKKVEGCKFFQTLGGVMKLLFILLLSLSFSTQITTREFEFELIGGQYNTYDFTEISGLDYGTVKLAPQILGEISNPDNAALIVIRAWEDNDRLTVYGYDNNYYNGGDLEDSYDICFSENLPSGGVDFFNMIDVQGNDNIILKFWITGTFQDEDTSMGDMNEDGNIDVLDVVALVNVILDDDLGNVFDVMKLAKKV